MSSFPYSPTWASASSSTYPLESHDLLCSHPPYGAESFDSFGPSDAQPSDAYYSYPAFQDGQLSSPSAGSSTASSSSTPATPQKDTLPSPLCAGTDATPSSSSEPLGAGWVSSTPFLPATASVAERCNETGFFLTLSSEVDKKLRTVQACDACRSRKAKCDGLKDSCTRCTQRGVSCSYTSGPRRPVAKTLKRPSICPSSRSDSVSSASSSSSSSLPLASHVKLQTVTSACKARKPSKIARRSSSDSTASALEPVIVDSSYSDDQELAFGWSNDSHPVGLAAPFEMSYSPAQPSVHTQYYPTPDRSQYRRSSIQHAPSPYAAPYPRQRARSHQVSSSVGFLGTPQQAPYTPRNESVLVQRRSASYGGNPAAFATPIQAAPYPSPDVAEEEYYYNSRPAPSNVFQTPIRRGSVAPMAVPPTPYTPAYPVHHQTLLPHQEATFDPFAPAEAQMEFESTWVESQPLWGDAIY